MIRKASSADLKDIFSLVENTIKAVYPKFYPSGAVDLYLHNHNKENIEKDIYENRVFVCCENNVIVGTVTICENDISRLYVADKKQGSGYGTQLLDFAENEISKKFQTAVLDCSLPAKNIYIKRGYKETAYKQLQADNGDYLCYDEMEKHF